ncbi:MAG TPA: ABC transporter permease [Bacteroidales bacterium]|nr:ABC transporter permease [Bacteroidales bacterium]HSA43093.1 ABC transporter permease [Bacteroidales bacterium]
MGQRLILLIKLIRESYLFALNAIIVNKLRTFLSLLGITIGIFSVISVLTVFDSIEREVKNSIASLGNNVLYIQKWPWFMGGGEYPWWKYMRRPEPKYDELALIQKRSMAAASAAYIIGTSRTVKYLNNSIESASISAVSHDYDKIWNFELSDGRYFSQLESSSGRPVAVIGATIAENLFQGLDPIGRKIKIWGREIEVIGLFKKEGSDNFGNSNDETVMIPVNFGRNFIKLDRDDSGAALMVKAGPNVTNDELRDELTGIMRSVRKLKPGSEDNFAINESTVIAQGFQQLFGVISLVGWIIGGFSLLVGGFGIANIMFVSVRERTTIIGIQKSLGAKNYFILLQFLFEAVFLSLFGGIAGLLIIWFGTLVVEWLFDMTLVLTLKNIVVGVGVSILIGLVSGIVPAWSASRLDPVEAIRSTGA